MGSSKLQVCSSVKWRRRCLCREESARAFPAWALAQRASFLSPLDSHLCSDLKLGEGPRDERCPSCAPQLTDALRPGKGAGPTSPGQGLGAPGPALMQASRLPPAAPLAGSHFFLVLHNIPLSGWTVVYPFTSWRASWMLASFGNYK